MGLAEDVGTIAPGKAADLIAMLSDPLKNSQAFRQVDMVMKSGKIVKSPPSVTIAP
jgi:imidazolonepropionase-like amidohydrolase